MAYSDYSTGVYLQGALGRRPELPMSADGLERAAAAAMDPDVLGYVEGGAGGEGTQRANVAAFARYGVVPRMLAGAGERDLSVDLVGMRLPSPLLVAPVGVLGVVAPDGDLETARAAAAARVPMIASTLADAPLEAVREAQGDGPGLFQLYPPADHALAESLVARAEVAGYAAVVITLDTWVNGWRPRDLQHAYLPMLTGRCLANYLTDPRFRALLEASGGAVRAPRDGAAVRLWASLFGDPAMTWADLPRFRALTRLPILLKGIGHPDDVKRALDGGMDGIVCSNHGGRQADGGVPAIDLLEDVVAAADGAPVVFDSGVRTGSDVVKALGLGATAVAVGRPVVRGLAVGGRAGVEHVLRSLLAEADLTMAVDGYPSIAALRGAVRRVG